MIKKPETTSRDVLSTCPDCDSKHVYYNAYVNLNNPNDIQSFDAHEVFYCSSCASLKHYVNENEEKYMVWCDVTINITGDEESIEVLWRHIVKEGLTGVKPAPEGADSLWAIEHWGTSEMRNTKIERTATSIGIEARTHYSPPLSLLRFISKQYNVVIVAAYWNVEMDYCGASRYEDGFERASEGLISTYMPWVRSEDYFVTMMELIEKEVAGHKEAIGG